MAPIKIQTSKRVVPMIYAYTTPEIQRHQGWTKIGYTEQDVRIRLKQQTHTADVAVHLEWQDNALYADGSGDSFRDTDFHSYLRKLRYENNPGTEWFHISGAESRQRFDTFKQTRGITGAEVPVSTYKLREEQDEAVSMTRAYFADHPNGEFLWNAKPRFGKTLSVYDLCKRMGAKKVLIVTNRPAIANSWYSDYAHFFGVESGYRFVSSNDNVKDNPGVLSREEFMDLPDFEECGCINFVSLQDLKGSKYFGGAYDKLKYVSTLQWDILVIDEAHEGVDTYKTDVAFDRIHRDYTLHLSGTPFKALANDKFPEEAIFNWTYADEQAKKRDWDDSNEEENPYRNLPKLNLFTYQMSEVIQSELQVGMEVDDEEVAYAFDLNEFFKTKTNGQFEHESSVDLFLDALTTQKKFPFSTPELRDELRHTMWLLNRVDSAKALAKKLQKHPIFCEYEIVLAAGDGKISPDAENIKSFEKVNKAIATYEKTITLSVGQLTTGVTIPEWTAVLMLSNMKSPALYMQAAFRAQNPHLFQYGSTYLRKENAYVFDFDPARTLDLYEQFANNLSPKTSGGKGDSDSRKENVRELLNFFPVIGEDAEGEMVELDAEKVLSIPRKIRSKEVVRRGFMCDFLFQNISNIFRAPIVVDILQKFEPIKEKDADIPVTSKTVDVLMMDENGEVNPDEAFVIGTAADLFGDKVFGDVEGRFVDVVEEITKKQPKDDPLAGIKKALYMEAVTPIMEVVRGDYGSELKASEKDRIERKLKEEADRRLEKVYGNHNIDVAVLEDEQQKAIESTSTFEERKAVLEAFSGKFDELNIQLKERLAETVATFIDDAGKEVVETVETGKRNKEKETIQDKVRDHLRGFSRTIPSFLMAYGNEDTTLGTFDTIIPNEVFFEVTGITLEEFRFLRDGGDYTDEETDEVNHFDGHLFDPVVFDDSVKEFLALRRKLANYFDESLTEDIFDYIPPQKNNQIFTPKWVVKKMVDLMEQENPGCFDDPTKTFADLYMKSGLYITEIVKKLFRSPKMKELYPDEKDRLTHIFAEQVYGLAPTEIIYRIAYNFILGFADNYQIPKHNLRCKDSLPYAKEGTMNQMLDELFQ